MSGTVTELTARRLDVLLAREQAAYPVPSLRTNKYWPPVRRIDQAHGDRNLMCSCPPVEAYA